MTSEQCLLYKLEFKVNIIASRNSYKILNRTKTDTGEWV